MATLSALIQSSANLKTLLPSWNSLAEPACLFGHSYGASVALGAAPAARRLARLVLYEPVPSLPDVSPPTLERLKYLARRRDLEAVLKEFYVDVLGLKPGELLAERSAPDWDLRVAAAATIIRELESAQVWKPDPKVYRQFTTPTLLLLGSETSEPARRTTEIVHSIVKNSRVVVLEGQGHIATATAPELVAAVLTQFLADG